jgi:hypothetical protein
MAEAWGRIVAIGWGEARELKDNCCRRAGDQPDFDVYPGNYDSDQKIDKEG